MSQPRHNSSSPTLVGSVLVAHPRLLDSNFIHSVVLVTAHSDQEGTVGLVLNQPTKKTVADLDEAFAFSPLSHVPVFTGGPVEKDKILFVAWRYLAEDNAMKLYFGISEHTAISLLQEYPQIHINAFMGYSSWTQGQLDQELIQHDWVLTTLRGRHHWLGTSSLWKDLLLAEQPELECFLKTPENPADN